MYNWFKHGLGTGFRGGWKYPGLLITGALLYIFTFLVADKQQARGQRQEIVAFICDPYGYINGQAFWGAHIGHAIWMIGYLIVLWAVLNLVF